MNEQVKFYAKGAPVGGSREAVIESLRRREREAKAKAPVEHTTTGKVAALEAIRDAHPGISSDAQEVRLLEALTRFPVSTFEAMRHLDAYHAPARIKGLRAKGHEIETVWIKTPTESGELHRVGMYVLLRGAEGDRQ